MIRRLREPLVLLLLLHVLVKGVLMALVGRAAFSGDETAYVDGGKALSNLVRDLLTFHSPHVAELSRNVVGEGWFMPGMSVVLTPLYLVAPSAGPLAVRLYVGVLTTMLLAVTALVVRRVFGTPYAVVLVAALGLMPIWLLFSLSTWGDPSAGLVVTLIVALITQQARQVADGRAPRARTGVLLGLLAIGCLYLRSNTFPLACGLLALAGLTCLVALRGAERRRGLLAALAGVATFAALLLPWSVAASAALDSRVVTTTTVPLSVGVTFGDADRLCFGPCRPGNPWFVTYAYSLDVGRASGSNALEVQKSMSAYAREDISTAEYADRIRQDFDSYLLHPADFVTRFTRHSDASTLDGLLSAASWALYAPLLALGGLGLLRVSRRSRDDQVLSLLGKLVTGALLLQPFVHQSSGRYWPVLAPVLALTATQLVLGIRSERAPLRILLWAQGALVAAFAVVACGLLVA